MISLADGLTKKEAAKKARCSEVTIAEAIKTGELPAFKPGRWIIILPADLSAWIVSKQIAVKVSPGRRPKHVKIHHRVEAAA